MANETKEIHYSSRELLAIQNANHLIVKHLQNKVWSEFTIYPYADETLYECLVRVHTLIDTDPQYARVILYIGNDDMIACVPKKYIPTAIKEILHKE